MRVLSRDCRILSCALLTFLLGLAFFSLLPSSVAQSIGTWSPTSSLPSTAASQFGTISCSTYTGYVYCIGGQENSFYAPLTPSGIGSWSLTTPFPMNPGSGGIASTSCAISSGYIYCVGGSGMPPGGAQTSNVYYASVTSTGIGNWVATAGYPMPVEGESCTTSVSYIYCVGDGDNGQPSSNLVYYSRVSAQGIAGWTQTTSYPIQIVGESCVNSGSDLYCIGGSTGYVNNSPIATSAVYYAPVSSNGVGLWTPASGYPVAVYAESCSLSSSDVYCVGGTQSNAVGTNAVYYATVSPVSLGGWSSATSYPGQYVNGPSCVSTNSNIYCVDNPWGETTSYYAPIADPTTSTATTLSSTTSTTRNTTTSSSTSTRTITSSTSTSSTITSSSTTKSTSSKSPATSTLTILTSDTEGNPVYGYYTVLNQTGSVVASGLTPMTFTLNDGQTYTVQVDNYGSCHFDYWQDTGSTTFYRVVAISTNTSYTAVMSCAMTSSTSTTSAIESISGSLTTSSTSMSSSSTTSSSISNTTSKVTQVTSNTLKADAQNGTTDAASLPMYTMLALAAIVIVTSGMVAVLVHRGKSYSS